MDKVRVAVLGHGHLGRWHAQKAAGLETCEFKAVVEPFNKDAVKEAYPDIKVVDKLEEVMDEIDAVVIVTPTSTHYELVKLALENKKHVFCEKPLCSTYEQTQSLQPLLGEQKLQVGHSERCHQAWETVKPQIEKIQAQKTLKIDRYAPFKGRATDVDVVQDLMIHDIDLMFYLLGKKPIEVRAIGHKIRTDKWDHVTAHFLFEDGDQVFITSGRNHVEEVRALELMSSSGAIKVDLFANKIFEGTDSEFEDGSFVKEATYPKRDHLLIEQERFYDSILNNKPVMVDFEAGASAVQLVSKVLESLEKQGPVSV